MVKLKKIKSKFTNKRAEKRVVLKLKQMSLSLLKSVRALCLGAVSYVFQVGQAAIKEIKQRRREGYRSFTLQKRIKPEPKDIPTSWMLLRQSARFLFEHKKVFGGLAAVHLLVYYILVRSPIQPDVRVIQNAISNAVENSGTQINAVQNTVVTIGAVVDSTSVTQQNGLVTAAVLLLMSLAYVWALRNLHNNHQIKVRDALYQGMAPIIPVLMIVGVLILQILPFAFASFIYSLARTGGIFVTGFEDLSFFLVTLLIGLLSAYWMTSAVLALYMVSLPGVYPVFALHSARKLVQFQRLRVFRRIVTLPLVFATVYLLVLLITIRLWPASTFVVAEIIQLLFIPFAHTYLYKLYRSLL